MRLRWVELADFRSYVALRFDPGESLNLLGGGNGAGKTNLLEAIAYLATLRSFRLAPDQALVRYGAEAAVIRALVEQKESVASVEVEVRGEGRRRVLVNGKRPRRTLDLLGVVRVIPFLPEDLDIVKGGPGYRRTFFDEAAVQLWPAAASDQADYERALRQRNTYLRQGRGDPPDSTLEAWDRELSQAGARVMARRIGAIHQLTRWWEESYHVLAGQDAEVGLRYESRWGGDVTGTADHWEESLCEALGASRREDLERGITTMGPHRDDPVLSLDGQNARFGASQGEQRSLALCLRLATHRAVTEAVGAQPILLLDDVFSELDPNRCERLAAALPSSQALITSAHPDEVPVVGKRWTVEGGQVW